MASAVAVRAAMDSQALLAAHYEAARVAQASQAFLADARATQGLGRQIGWGADGGMMPVMNESVSEPTLKQRGAGGKQKKKGRW